MRIYIDEVEASLTEYDNNCQFALQVAVKGLEKRGFIVRATEQDKRHESYLPFRMRDDEYCIITENDEGENNGSKITVPQDVLITIGEAMLSSAELYMDVLLRVATIRDGERQAGPVVKFETYPSCEEEE